MKQLISSSSDALNARDRRDGNTPLYEALDNAQCTEVIECLISAGADVNAVNFLSSTPLMYAQTDKLQLLLDAGADVNARSPVGSTVLHLAATYNIDLDKIACLLAAGADATATDTIGSTHAAAAACGHTAAAALLRKAEAEQRSMQSHLRAALLPADLQFVAGSRGWRCSSDVRRREAAPDRGTAQSTCAIANPAS
jgi:ankyrin repeat protein